MKIVKLFRCRLITRYSLLLTPCLLGCSQQTPEQVGANLNVVVAAEPVQPPKLEPPKLEPPKTPETPKLPAPPVKPPEAPTVFEYPTDLAGKAVVKAVTPTVFVPTTGKLGAGPLPRTVPAKVVNPEAADKARYVPPPITLAKPADVKLLPPAERVPVELGFGAGDVPAKPTFPIAAGITERARDVNLPPAMPTLGRPFNERVSLEDPTSDFGNASVIAPPVKVPVSRAGFLKVTLPDPFELGEQVKPKVPSAAEPGQVPIVVNPQRVK